MINSTQFTVAIIIMAIITFTMRYVFFSNIIKIELNDGIKTILLFTAPCVLTAMMIPIMFQDLIESKNLVSIIHSRYFLAGVATVILSLFIRQTLIVIVLSMALFYGLGVIVAN